MSACPPLPAEVQGSCEAPEPLPVWMQMCTVGGHRLATLSPAPLASSSSLLEAVADAACGLVPWGANPLLVTRLCGGRGAPLARQLECLQGSADKVVLLD